MSSAVTTVGVIGAALRSASLATRDAGADGKRQEAAPVCGEGSDGMVPVIRGSKRAHGLPRFCKARRMLPRAAASNLVRHCRDRKS